MSKSKPTARRVFDKAERTIGEPLEELVQSKTFTEALGIAIKLQRRVNGAVFGAAAGAVEKMLHTAQIPTRSDVRNLNQQIVELTAEVRTLAQKLQEARREAREAKAQAASRPARKKKAKKKTSRSATKPGDGN